MLRLALLLLARKILSQNRDVVLYQLQIAPDLASYQRQHFIVAVRILLFWKTPLPQSFRIIAWRPRKRRVACIFLGCFWWEDVQLNVVSKGDFLAWRPHKLRRCWWKRLPRYKQFHLCFFWLLFWLYEEVNRLFGWGAIIDDCSVRKSGVECSFKVGLLFRAF